MFSHKIPDTTCDVWSRFFPARGETRPIIEIDNSHVTILGDNAISPVNMYVQYLGCLVAKQTKLRFVEGDPFAVPLITSKPNLL